MNRASAIAQKHFSINLFNVMPAGPVSAKHHRPVYAGLRFPKKAAQPS